MDNGVFIILAVIAVALAAIWINGRKDRGKAAAPPPADTEEDKPSRDELRDRR